MEGSDAEFARVREAVRRGWVDEAQVSRCLAERGTADGLLDALRASGWLSSAQVKILRGERPPVEDGEAVEILGPGDVLAGRYTVEEVHRGGFGAVYVCRSDAGRVALKTMLRRHLLDDTVVAMFREEVLRWIGLGAHPNIVLAYGLEDFLRLPFVVMECVEGGRTLKDVVKADPGAAAALRYGVQIARGLAHAGRACGLVHRDLKPANVLVTPEGVAKVADFGLSLVGGRQDGRAVGTPLYMAPEQWEKGAVDVRTDLYAFGLILYELAVGAFPFQAKSLEELQEAHLRRPPPRPDVAPALATFILRCLEKDPRRRPRDFEEAVLVLEAAGAPREERRESNVPGLAEGCVNRSVTLLRLGRPVEAAAAAREATRRAPDWIDGWVALANALGASGDAAGAYRVLEEAAGLDPRSGPVLTGLAYHAFQAGRRDEASRRLDEARRFLPAEALETVSSLFVELGRLEEALEVCGRILAKHPRAVMAWNTQAVALRRTGDLEGALRSADRAVELNPRYAKGWSNRATILVQLDRYDEAIWSADSAIAADPSTAGAWAAKAAALGLRGSAREGVRCLEEGLRTLPGHPLLTKALERAKTL